MTAQAVERTVKELVAELKEHCREMGQLELLSLVGEVGDYAALIRASLPEETTQKILSVVRENLESAEKFLAPGDHLRAKMRLRHARDLARQVYSEVRSVEGEIYTTEKFLQAASQMLGEAKAAFAEADFAKAQYLAQRTRWYSTYFSRAIS